MHRLTSKAILLPPLLLIATSSMQHAAQATDAKAAAAASKHRLSRLTAEPAPTWAVVGPELAAPAVRQTVHKGKDHHGGHYQRQQHKQRDFDAR